MRIHQTQGRTARQTEAILTKLEQRSGSSLESVLPSVRKILRNVRQHGDKALLEYAKKFDGFPKDSNNPSSLRVTQEEMSAAWSQLTPALRQALETAAANI